jgi:hypothetical protein
MLCAADQKPSAHETSAWLIEKLKDYQCTIVFPPSPPDRFSVQKINFDDGVFTILALYSIAGGKPEKTAQSLKLASLSPKTEVRSFSNANQVIVTSSNGREKIMLIIRDKDIADRIASALGHLITLHGGKAEPF